MTVQDLIDILTQVADEDNNGELMVFISGQLANPVTLVKVCIDRNLSSIENNDCFAYVEIG